MTLGKMFEKIWRWRNEYFVCANAGEAKKIVLELKKYKKALSSIAKSPNAVIQGEAMLYQMEVDALIESIPNRVKQ